MSTTDPAHERRRKAERSRGSAPALLSSILAAAACLAAGYLFGRGLSGIVGIFRWMTFESINEMDTDAPPYIWGLFVGIFGGILALGWLGASTRRFSGGGRVVVPGIALAAVGNAVGFWLQSQDWPPPTTVGFTSLWASPEPWGPAAWVMYHASTWMPAVAAGAAVLVVGGSLLFHARRRRTRTRAQELLTGGRRAQGLVTEVRPTGVEIQGVPVVAFTVRFVDQTGAERWVTKKSVVDPAEMPWEGQPVAVLYDAQRMREKDIMVVLEPLDSVERKIRSGAGAADLAGARGLRGASRRVVEVTSQTQVSVRGTPRTDVQVGDGAVRAAMGGDPAALLQELAAAGVLPPSATGAGTSPVSPSATTAATSQAPGWAYVEDVVLAPASIGVAASLTVRVEVPGAAPLRTDLQMTFASGSPKQALWCRVGARVPVLVQPGSPPVVTPDLTR